MAMKADVVVAGGGPSGLGAALASDRGGTKTALVERFNCLGGMATAGLVINVPFTSPARGGILKEMLDGLTKIGAAQSFNRKKSLRTFLFNPEMFKQIADRMIKRAGIGLLLNSLVVGAVMDGETLKGIVVENKSGRQAILGKVFVDATGDGDVAAAAGVPYKIEKTKALPISLMYLVGGVDNRRVRKYQAKDAGLKKAARRAGFYHRSYSTMRRENRGPIFVHMDGVMKGQVAVWSEGVRADGTDATKITEVEVGLRKLALAEVEFLKRHVPGFGGAYLAATAPYLGVRETRRVVGEYVLKEKDYRVDFPDSVVRLTYSGEPDRVYDVPYRCLLAKGVDNLLVAGRCFSATHEVQNKLREIPACVAMGEVAGRAAAMSVKRGVKPKELDTKILLKTLNK